ncbi:dihydrodipicolinate synthase family protein [Cohnella phaseoli]|uniref:4-hydroxy-tetrahydrodipicolinate synthase n=1 Tax=Cohnella phaseoli TaxID=456490 RepID=A0A3D9I750_9BACL|nr:dihydrodipicolinate synthase family protein [Cohnella phaseoli]RED57465.1 4-hydroxy-tetrahydrodipicolinate synthase [Cohnella phaseoli]
MKKLHGVIPILPAPFTDDGANVDYSDLRSIVDTVIAEGVHGVALLGVASEFYKIDDAERQLMIETTVEHVAGRVPVVVNITRNATALAVKDARHAEEAGADAVMIVPPSFIPPGNEAIIEHIHAVADSVKLPVVIQYAPNVTGVSIPVSTFLDIERQRGGELYIKAESVPPGPLLNSIVEQTEGRMGVFIGNGCVQMYDSLERGAVGMMPGAAMVVPYLAVYEAFMRGDKTTAFRLFNDLLPVLNHTTQAAELFVQFEKTILKARGIVKNDVCRRPNAVPDEAMKTMLRRYSDYVRERFGAPLMP